MFHDATKVCFKEKTIVEITYRDGNVIQFDIRSLYDKYPQFKVLEEDQQLFYSGQLDPGGYGVVWNDELDLSMSGVYRIGKVVDKVETSLNNKIAAALCEARDYKLMTQTDLAKKSGLDQGDICKIERGQGNPTLKKISKLFDALDVELIIKIKPKKKTA